MEEALEKAFEERGKRGKASTAAGRNQFSWLTERAKRSSTFPVRLLTRRG